jgi:ribosomal protein S18 acetylase RimI-like enzyme
MTVEEVVDPAERSLICAEILRKLPVWFGIEEAVERYIGRSAELPMLVVRDGDEPAGFLTLQRHSPHAAELYLMGVRPELHRRGIETALLEAAESRLAADGGEYVQVKTLGPSRPSRGYGATRRFYEARGFRALEEIPDFWGHDNPCLVMVKRLECR